MPGTPDVGVGAELNVIPLAGAVVVGPGGRLGDPAVLAMIAALAPPARQTANAAASAATL
jgi:hypothetical protein